MFTDLFFRQEVSTEILNEDVNGSDEIIARFTLVDNSNGRSVSRRSNQVTMTF